MKNELIQLAKEKKFSSNIISEEPWKYSVNEELRWLFWMTNLQKWLREVYSIDIIIEFYDLNPKTYEGFIMDKEFNKYFIMNSEDYSYEFKDYEASLEAGLYNALQLIK